MNTRCPQSSRWALVAILGAFASLAAASEARAQAMLGWDPYRPYNGGYESFGLPPSASNNFEAINSQRARTFSSSANQMSQFYDDLYGNSATPGQPDTARRTAGSTYYEANRAYDQEFGRVYVPNPKDAEFYKDQQERTKEYFDALKEKDPKKRAERLRAIELKNLQAARSLSPNTRLPANITPRSTRAATPTRSTVGLPATRPAPAGASGARSTVGSGTGGGTRSTLTPTPPGTAVPTTPLSGRGSASLLDPGTGRGGSGTSALRGSASTPATGSGIRPLGSRYSSTPNRPGMGTSTPLRERPSDILNRALADPAPTDDAEPVVPPLFPRGRSSSAPPR